MAKRRSRVMFSGPWPVADAAAVLIIVPVENVVATVLDDPVPAVNLEHASGAGLLGRAAGEAVGDFQRDIRPVFLFVHVPLDEEGLAHMGKVEIVVEFGGRPDFARFQAAVIGRGLLDEMRLAPVLEVELQASRAVRAGCL